MKKPIPQSRPKATVNEFINPRAAAIFDSQVAGYFEDYHSETLPYYQSLSDEEKAKWDREPLTPTDMVVMWENAAANYCQSPIEQMLLAALMFCSTGYGPHPLEIWHPDLPFAPPRGSVFLTTQFEFGEYRIDLAVFGKDFSGNEFRVAVECDGYEYHKSKEQTKIDRKRDRFLLSHGWHTLRFTGSEIWRDAESCAEEVGNFVCQLFDDDLERTQRSTTTYRKRELRKLGYVSPFERGAE